MNTTWIIENIAKEESYKGLTEAVEALGYPLIKINGDYSKNLLSGLNEFYTPADRNCVIVNASIEMAKLLRKDLKLSNQPVLYCDFPKYKCSAYYSHFGPYLFNDKYALISLKELERQKFDVWGHYGKDSLIFIRPDSGEKTFQAGLLDFLDLSKFLDAHQDCLHDLILVSTPKNIKWEGRIICSKYKEVIAHSTYRFQGQVTKVPSIPEGATKLVKELLEVNYYPDSVFVYDLCQCSDGKFWLLELTSFSSCGVYECDKKAIIQKVSEIAWKEFNDKPNN